MDTQPISNCCPKCHTPLPPDAPQGLCPKCLFAAVATPTEAGQPAGHRATPPPLEEIAAAFPQLEILEFIGQGGMGFVFKARQPKLDRLVALKILPQSLATDPTFAERFNREARLLARLSHPGIVTVHDFGVTAHQPSTLNHQPFYYLLMEFVDGVNLRQAMQAGRFTPEQALDIVPKICEALQFAHNEGILHRDIKPENILLDAKGRVKLADFGIAKLVGDVGQAFQPASAGDFPVARSETGDTGLESPVNRQAGKPALLSDALTETGKTLGTPNYMAPEQLERPGEVDHRADIYSLGVVFYEMLTGELPLGRFAPPSQRSAADPRVDEVVLRALEKEKARRYASADEVKTQVETLVTSSSQREEAPAESRKRKVESEKQAEPRFSRMAIIGAIWAVAFGLCALLENIGLNTYVIGPLSVLAPIITTALGWIAVTRIRQSAGSLYGIVLAVFDGLLFPLLALNFSIGCFVWVVLAAVVSLITRDGQGSPSTALVVLLSLPIAIPLNRFIIRRVWRAVNQSESDNPPQPSPSRLWIVAAIAGGTALLSLGGLLLVKKPTASKSSFGPYWTDHLRLNQVIASDGSYGVSRYGDDDFRYETTFNKKSCALTISYRQKPGAAYQVQIEERSGQRRLLDSVIERFTQTQRRYQIVEQKVLLDRSEFSRIAAFVLQKQTADQPVGQLGFTPVLERPVEMSMGSEFFWFDLEIGQSVPSSLEDEVYEPAAFAEWLKQSGVDFRVVEEGRGGTDIPRGLDAGTTGCLLVPVNESHWDSLPADRLPSLTAPFTNRVTKPWLVSKRELPATAYFKTRAGTEGLLQITSFMESPMGVKLRYKQAQNGSAPKVTLPTKTIVLTRATNQLVGTTTDTRTVNVWSDATLQPDEQLSALVEQPDGEVKAATSQLFSQWGQGKVSTSTSFSWFFKEVDGFGAAEADAATTQIREQTTRPQALKATVPLVIFQVTNRFGGVMVGKVEFRKQTAAVTAAGKKAEASIRLRPYVGLLTFYSASVPSGYRLQATDNSSEAGGNGAHTAFNGRTDSSSSWSPPSSMAYEQQQEACTQMKRLAEQGPIQVVLGEPHQVFSITNKVGEIYKGFFELVGPPGATGQP